tara:strand:+ start:243 stop:662 length:420 start_codon:yes stop_codon:yes gene_type:complete
MEIHRSYLFYREYCFLRELIERHSPAELTPVNGQTAYYDLPDFRMCWQGIRVIGLHPRPKGVELLLEYDKFMRDSDQYDQDLIVPFEDACGALITNKNRLFKLTCLDTIDQEYLETYIACGIPLYLAYLHRKHPDRSKS